MRRTLPLATFTSSDITLSLSMHIWQIHSHHSLVQTALNPPLFDQHVQAQERLGKGIDKISGRSRWGTRKTLYIVTIFLTSIWWLPRLFLALLEHGADLPPMDTDLPLVTVLYAIAALVGISCVYFQETRRRDRNNAQTDNELAALRQLQYEQQTLGDASESLVGETLLEYALALDPDASLNSGIIMRYPQTRPGQMSRFEVDCLLQTHFGIFLVEVKNWKNPVSVTQEGWQVHRPNGIEAISSPIQQGAPKKRVIRELVEQHCANASACRVESIVVMCHPDASFPMDAPREVVYLADLRYYLRLAYHRAIKAGLPPKHELALVRTAIADLHDAAPDAKHRFLIELAETTGGAQEYLAYERRRQALIGRSPAIVRPLWCNAYMYLPSLLVLGLTSLVVAYAKGPVVPRITSATVNTTAADIASRSVKIAESIRTQRTPSPAEK